MTEPGYGIDFSSGSGRKLLSHLGDLVKVDKW